MPRQPPDLLDRNPLMAHHADERGPKFLWHLANSARQEAAAGIAHLAAPGAKLLVAAFAPGRRVLLPRGMDQQDVIGLFGDTWDLEHTESASDATAPRPVRRARPSLYRLTRKGQADEPPGS